MIPGDSTLVGSFDDLPGEVIVPDTSQVLIIKNTNHRAFLYNNTLPLDAYPDNNFPGFYSPDQDTLIMNVYAKLKGNS